MIEHDVQKVVLHAVHVVLKLMVDLDQSIIAIIIVANRHKIVNPSLQKSKSKPKVTQSIL